MTYFIGIDIAKYKYDCFIYNHKDEVIYDSPYFFICQPPAFQTAQNNQSHNLLWPVSANPDQD